MRLDAGPPAATARANAWDHFWESAVPNERAHRAEALEFVRRLARDVGVSPSARVLDYGCGFGFVAAALAQHVQSVVGWDKHEHIRRLARSATAQHTNVRIVDALPPGQQAAAERFDLILVNSVVQYMTHGDLTAALSDWCRLLAAGGRVVVSDLVAPGHASWHDLVDLMRFKPLAQLRRIGGELRRYRGTRADAVLLQVSPSDLAQRAAAVGLELAELPANLTHFRRRYAATLCFSDSPERRR
ncbi:MAG: class I SAM-dependent methyltransferase [Gemmatimonadaceae bacterium]